MAGDKVSKGRQDNHATFYTKLEMCFYCNGKHLNYFNKTTNKIGLAIHQNIYFPNRAAACLKYYMCKCFKAISIIEMKKHCN